MLKALGKDVAVYGFADFVFRFIGFAVFPVYAHVFSVDEFGIFALVTTAAGIVALFANLGLNNATQRHYWDPHTPNGMQSTIVSTGLGVLVAWSCAVVLLLAACLYPAREIITARYGISWSIVLIALLTIIPEQLLQYCLDVLRLHFSPWRFALVSFSKNLLGISVGLVLILLFDGGLKGLFLGALAGALAAVPLAMVLIRRDLKVAFHSETAKQLVTFGYPFIFAGIAYWLFGGVDRWMLVELSNSTELGLYAIAYKFAAVVLFISTAFGQAWSPFAMKLRQSDSHYPIAFARIFSVWSFLLVMAGSTLALFGGEILQILTPREYWAASSSLGILVMGVVLSGTTQITAIGISLARKTRLFAIAAWVTALFNICLNFLLIPFWGADGAAFATFLSYGLLTSLYLYWSQKLHPIPLETPKLLYSLALVVSMVGLSVGLAGLDISIYLILAKVALLTLMVAGAVHFRIVDVSNVWKLIKERPWA